MTIAPVQQSPAWHGSLQLEFSHRLGETLLSHSQMQAPLKVQRPFYPEGSEVCHTVVLHTAGGIVGGDRLSLDIYLKAQAQALVTTAAATKVYRSQAAEAAQNTRIYVAPGACLEWLPQEAILFNGANYRQDLRVELAAEATWLGWDIIRLGRTARDERFITGDWRSRTEVWQQGQLLWVDPQQVIGGSDRLTSPHGLAGCSVVASLVWVGQPATADLVAQARTLFTGDGSSQAGVSRIRSGLLCRYRGNSTAEARRWLTQVWHLLRAEMLGRAACIPRVWQA